MQNILLPVCLRKHQNCLNTITNTDYISGQTNLEAQETLFDLKLIVLCTVLQKTQTQTPVADPGFPVGGAWTHWGRGSPTRVLFGKNAC